MKRSERQEQAIVFESESLQPFTQAADIVAE